MPEEISRLSEKTSAPKRSKRALVQRVLQEAGIGVALLYLFSRSPSLHGRIQYHQHPHADND